MIKQLIDIDGYWEVIVYYNVDYNFFSDIAFELKAIGSPVERIDDVYYNLKYEAKAVTCSNIKEQSKSKLKCGLWFISSCNNYRILDKHTESA